jgi:hypothetical protein
LLDETLTAHRAEDRIDGEAMDGADFIGLGHDLPKIDFHQNGDQQCEDGSQRPF